MAIWGTILKMKNIFDVPMHTARPMFSLFQPCFRTSQTSN